MEDHVYLISFLEAEKPEETKKKKEEPVQKVLFTVLYDSKYDRVCVFNRLNTLQERLTNADRITEYGGHLGQFPALFGKDWDAIALKSDDLLPRVARAKHPDAQTWDLTREDYRLLAVAEENPPALHSDLVTTVDFAELISKKLIEGDIGNALTKAFHLLFVLRDLSNLVDTRGWIIHKGHQVSILPYRRPIKVSEASANERIGN